MITELILHNFKNFRRETLDAGPLTVLVGANASGKSNIRDAFRFLHGIARGYTLSEIMGEKWIEGGILQWRGIRGGVREVAHAPDTRFILVVSLDFVDYKIEVDVGQNGTPPYVVREWLSVGSPKEYESFSDSSAGATSLLEVRIPPGGKYRRSQVETFSAQRPILSQILERLADRNDATGRRVKAVVKDTLATLGSMQFLDLAPDAMRLPSFPGQTILGDRGENLSSVLQAICADEQRKKTLIEWIRELTPMDATDFDFVPDQTGRILLTLVEQSGQRTSAYSASDGTLRFLTIIAALLGPDPARFYFIEELENGVHPTRLHLLMQLLETHTATSGVQVVATSHSPQLLGFLGETTLKNAALVYRLPGTVDAHIQRIVDFPDAREIIEQQGLTSLHAAGWLEDAAAFLRKAE